MLYWDYAKNKAHLYIPGYADKALQHFKKRLPPRLQHQPYHRMVPVYGAKVQYAKTEDSSQPLTKEESILVQQFIGNLLFYGSTVDVTTLMALSTMTSEQSATT